MMTPPWSSISVRAGYGSRCHARSWPGCDAAGGIWRAAVPRPGARAEPGRAERSPLLRLLSHRPAARSPARRLHKGRPGPAVADVPGRSTGHPRGSVWPSLRRWSSRMEATWRTHTSNASGSCACMPRSVSMNVTMFCTVRSGRPCTLNEFPAASLREVRDRTCLDSVKVRHTHPPCPVVRNPASGKRCRPGILAAAQASRAGCPASRAAIPLLPVSRRTGRGLRPGGRARPAGPCAPGDGVLDPLVVLEAVVAVSLDGGVVDEDVGRAVVGGDEPVALGRVEPRRPPQMADLGFLSVVRRLLGATRPKASGCCSGDSRRRGGRPRVAFPGRPGS
jgi:hypothetical protein